MLQLLFHFIESICKTEVIRGADDWKTVSKYMQKNTSLAYQPDDSDDQSISESLQNYTYLKITGSKGIGVADLEEATSEGGSSALRALFTDGGSMTSEGASPPAKRKCSMNKFNVAKIVKGSSLLKLTVCDCALIGDECLPESLEELKFDNVEWRSNKSLHQVIPNCDRIKSITLFGTDIPKLELSKFPNLTELNISSLDFSKIENLESLKKLNSSGHAKLKEGCIPKTVEDVTLEIPIGASFQSYSGDFEKLFQNPNGLKSLTLKPSSTNLFAGSMHQFPNLEYLDIPVLSFALYKDVKKHCQKLRSLKVRSSMVLVGKICKYSNLEHLKLHIDNELDLESLTSHIQKLSNLKVIELVIGSNANANIDTLIDVLGIYDASITLLDFQKTALLLQPSKLPDTCVVHTHGSNGQHLGLVWLRNNFAKDEKVLVELKKYTIFCKLTVMLESLNDIVHSDRLKRFTDLLESHKVN